MNAVNNLTARDLWSYISSNITNKVNDPFEEINGVIIPVKRNGSFDTPIKSDDYENVYDWISHLCSNTDPFETPSFGFMIPGWKRDPETMERDGQIITFILVKSYEQMEVGAWMLDTNELHFLSEEAEYNDPSDGPLSMALSALSVGIAIERGGMGQAGALMRKAKRYHKRANELAEKAVAMLAEQTKR